MTAAAHTNGQSRSATFADWLEGARPHTWANAFAPVVVGVGAADRKSTRLNSSHTS